MAQPSGAMIVSCNELLSSRRRTHFLYKGYRAACIFAVAIGANLDSVLTRDGRAPNQHLDPVSQTS